MKRIAILLLAFGISSLHAQYSESPGTIKASTGYTHDFPGLNGYTVMAEYTFLLAGPIDGGIGVKHADMTGFPRTNLVQEYTHANSLDFNLYWRPLETETQAFRIGLGYSFSFYQIKRAYPVITGTGDGKSTSWPSRITGGRTTGINLIAEYEYKFSNMPISLGVRGALYKAYDRTYFIGPVIGYRL
jgi:hypothetical protein